MRLSPLFAAVLLAAPAAALAQQAPAPQPLSKSAFMSNMQAEFAQVDANKDGAVSTAELETARSKAVAEAVERRSAAAFAQLDTDKNGALSQAEFAKAMRPTGNLPASPLVAMDSNKDGKISAAEYKTGMEARFTRADTNKDGVITAADAPKATPSR